MFSRVLHESAFRKADLKLSFSLGNKVTSLSKGFHSLWRLRTTVFSLQCQIVSCRHWWC